MKFTKMHGIGNDYVYVDCFSEKVEKPAETARFVSDRHFGIGSDGLILIKPSDKADCEMEMYNLDGSLGAMCGNGIRCVAKYIYDHDIVKKTTLLVNTASGIRELKLQTENGKVRTVTVNMGEPVLDSAKIPVAVDAKEAIGFPISIDGSDFSFTAVSMGNPHAVVFVPNPGALLLPEIGPLFEHHPLFPDRVNTEFIQVIGPARLKMRVWERGSGETMACGTGACASVVAAILNGYAAKDTPVTVELLGGELSIEWRSLDNMVYMTGPATEVFSGEIPLPDFT